jgi:hypothetical protein
VEDEEGNLTMLMITNGEEPEEETVEGLIAEESL